MIFFVFFLGNYLLGYIWNKFSQLELIVIKSLITLLCRVTKLGWQTDERHQQLTNHINKFFEVCFSIKLI